MKFFREIDQDTTQVQDGDLAFLEDEEILKSHRVSVEKYVITDKGVKAAAQVKDE